MKTPDETKRGLECCGAPTSECDACPYHSNGDGDCVDEMKRDALALIRQLEVDKVKLLEESHEVRKDMFERIKQLEAERDAAVADIPRACGYCKYYVESANECTNPLPCACVSGVNTRWEWRGVQKET